MDAEEFKKNGAKLIDYLINYLQNIHLRHVTPFVEPGYLSKCLPEDPPAKPEPFDDVLKDFDNLVLPGLTHWAHPKFHAYFPSGRSFPSLLGTMLADGFGIVGFSWLASPVCFELEVVMMDWMGRLLGLPNKFLNTSGRGGGVIQSSASDSMLSVMIAARHFAIKTLIQQHPNVSEGVILSKLIAYCSQEAHSCIEKAARLSLVQLRTLETNDEYQLTGSVLVEAIKEDKKKGLVPFFVCATLGTPSCCSCDLLSEIGPICYAEGIWLHVEAAYAGAAMILPEYSWLRKGLNQASSININPHKWLQVTVDCACLWVQDKKRFTEAFLIMPLYLKHQHAESMAHIDLRNWGIPLTRRFRSLKLFFLLRLYGAQKLRDYINNHTSLAKYFAKLVQDDSNFLVCNEVNFGVVCFRLKGSNQVNETFLSTINASGKIYLVPASMKGNFVLRFAVCQPNLSKNDVLHSWKTIQKFAATVLKSQAEVPKDVALQKPPIEKAKVKRSFFVRMSSNAGLTNQRISKFEEEGPKPPSAETRRKIFRPFEKSLSVEVPEDFLTKLQKEVGE